MISQWFQHKNRSVIFQIAPSSAKYPELLLSSRPLPVRQWRQVDWPQWQPPGFLGSSGSSLTSHHPSWMSTVEVLPLCLCIFSVDLIGRLLPLSGGPATSLAATTRTRSPFASYQCPCPTADRPSPQMSLLMDAFLVSLYPQSNRFCS